VKDCCDGQVYGMSMLPWQALRIETVPSQKATVAVTNWWR
jgi:hypothetical protein